MLFLFLAPTFFSPTFAQTKKATARKANPKAKTAPAARTAPAPRTTTPALTAPALAARSPIPKLAAPAPAPIPWRLSYFGEWYGSRLGSIDFNRASYGPDDFNSGYPAWYHYVKIGYAIKPNLILGTQLRGVNTLNDPTVVEPFVFKDLRFYLAWSNMLSTRHLDMSTTLVAEFPTTDASRVRGKLFAFQLKNNWTLKTSLRKWSFSATTLINPIFYQNPYGTNGAGTTDYVLAIYPWITADLTTNLQFLIEASLDATHNYAADAYDFRAGDPDFIGFGLFVTVNEHFSFYPEIRPWLDDISLKSATLYLGVNAAL